LVRTFAILPVKRFEDAKERLRGALAPSARRALARAMVHDVLDALDRVRGIARIVVVTAEESVRALAAARGDAVIDDRYETGQSTAAALGIERAGRAGAEQVLLVPGDCPALWPEEVDGMLRRHARGSGVVLVPDRHGTGTNGLLLAPPDAIAPSFGEGSRRRHLREAVEAGYTPAIEPLVSLGLDVDTPADLEALEAALARIPEHFARHTRATLADLRRRPAVGRR
jgi:2-phospho-L-lactate/phosphoenolpyruvate guanylyltransferase